MLRETNGVAVPECRVPGRVCPIQDIMSAPDSLRLMAKVRAFIRAEGLAQAPGFAPVVERTLREAGLLEEDAETLIEMKVTMADFRKFQAEQG